MRNPRFDPDKVLIEDQRPNVSEGNDRESRYRGALNEYINRRWDALVNAGKKPLKEDEIIRREHMRVMKENNQAWNAADNTDRDAVLARARYGEYPTIQSAGDHANALTPILRKLLGL